MSRKRKSVERGSSVLELVRYDGLAETVSLDAVRPLAGNARVHTDEQLELLVESIRRFGVYRPLVVHRATGQILAGNGLYEAARRAGLTELPVVWFDGSESEALALSLTDNRAGELSDWDYSLLSVLASRAPEALDWAVLDAEFRSALESLAGDWVEEAASVLESASVSSLGDEGALSAGLAGESSVGVSVESSAGLAGESSVQESAGPPEVRHAGVYIVRLDADGVRILSRWGEVLGMAVDGDLLAELVRRSELWLEEYDYDDADHS